MNRHRAALLLACTAVVFATACSSTANRTPFARKEPFDVSIPTGFINKFINLPGGAQRYVVYVPYDYTPDKEWPLIVFLHGAGERGEDGLKQTAVGIGHAIRKNPERFPCIVLMPQCPEDSYWLKHGEDVLGLMDVVTREYRIDPDRVYLTGLSMGGYGAWYLGAQRPDLFAALMPICGGGRGVEVKKFDPKSAYPDADLAQLAKRPIWAFHGDADQVVPVDTTRYMVKAVKAVGGEVHYTELPGVAHNSWDAAYADEKAIKWLFKQRR